MTDVLNFSSEIWWPYA